MNQQNFAFLSFIHPLGSFILIVGLLTFWFLKKKLPSIKSFKRILNIFIVVILLQAFLETFLNWWLWSKEKVTQRLLPPFTPLTYVLHYSWQHYLFEPIITILFALIIFKIIALLNKKFNNVFFYDEEPYLAAFGILATGWPNCLMYLCLVLFLGVLFHFINYFLNGFVLRGARDIFFRNHPQPTCPRRRGGQGVAEGDERGEDIRERARWASERVEENISRVPFRLSLLYFWFPCALLVLLLSGIISKYLLINQFLI
jgi:ABC-type multidrug transport system fused ATPase/permease subunit